METAQNNLVARIIFFALSGFLIVFIGIIQVSNVKMAKDCPIYAKSGGKIFNSDGEKLNNNLGIQNQIIAIVSVIKKSNLR